MLNKQTIHLLLAAMILHLAACSFSGSVPSQTHHSILSARQTHEILKKWSTHNYRNQPQHKKITFTNKHPFAPSIYKIISGYKVATLCHRTKGIGLPVIVQTQPNNFTQITPKAHLTNIYAGSLIATKQPNGNINITLLDPRTTQHYHHYPIKIQHSIVIDHINSLPSNRSLSLKGLLNPLRLQHLQGFYLSQPYDKKKIPIIMIHGLYSSPKAFKKMAAHIENQPDLFKKYQIWHYYYPTGTPWLVTAHHFRKSYRGLIKKIDPHSSHPNLRKTTIIAHSMGGLITRLSLSKPQKHLSQIYLDKHGLNILSKSQQEKILPLFHYQPLTEPQQAIFLAVPHRGSKMASGAIGWCVEKFITIPNFIIKGAVKAILPKQKSKLSKETLRLLTKGENAINQLEPNNPAIKALNKMKLPKHLKTHSIIGDITLLLFKAYTDGVVTYHSSHLPQSNSETIIPSNHEIINEPKAIKRVIEILRAYQNPK